MRDQDEEHSMGEKEDEGRESCLVRNFGTRWSTFTGFSTS